VPPVSRAQLLASVDGVLTALAPGARAAPVRQADDAAYAAYVFGLILRAAATVADAGSLALRSARSVPGAVINQFVVRGAPGYIYSIARDYGYAVFRCNNNQYEVHLGVQYFGASGVLHEFDISIIDANAAATARANFRNPSSGKARIVFECKYYAHTLDIALGREFAGLLTDFSNAKSARLVTNSTSRSIRTFLTERVRYRLNDQLSPANPAAENQFVHSVADDLRNRLR
jgi:hypothetical protein